MRLLETLWDRSTLRRVRQCGRYPAQGKHSGPVAEGTSSVAIRVKDGVAHFSGLRRCGSVWGCPECQPKILNKRANDVARAAGRWDRDGNTVIMATFTMPHDYGNKLAALMIVIALAFRTVICGRPWRRIRDALGIVGTIRSVEITHGRNGWHPHLHVLIFATGDLDAAQLVALDGYLSGKWARVIADQGYRTPSGEHGVKIEICRSAEDAGAYISKTEDGRSVGLEVARGDLKHGRNGHRTPLEILASFAATGDLADLALWREYERATKGHQRITWSARLRDLLLPDDPDKTDEEIAAEEVGGDIAVMIPQPVWWRITKVRGLRSRLLRAAELDGAGGVSAVLAEHQITRRE